MTTTRALLALALSLCLAACGDSTSAAGGAGGSAKKITSPAELPDDQAGLVKVYESCVNEIIGLLEGVDTEEQLASALEKMESYGPAFRALMERSEELGTTVDEGTPESEELHDRMSAATKRLFEKFPKKYMEIQNAFAGAMGGLGG